MGQIFSTTSHEGFGSVEHGIVETCIKLARTPPMYLQGFMREESTKNNTCVSVMLNPADVTSLTHLWQGSAIAFGTLWKDTSKDQFKPCAPIQVTFKLVPGFCAYKCNELNVHGVDPKLRGFPERKSWTMDGIKLI
jgi:hypothetical protein